MSYTIDPMDSPRYTLLNAKRHARAFARDFDYYASTRPYSIVKESDLCTGNTKVVLKLDRQPPLSLANVANDAFENLRKSLDQLGFAIASSVHPEKKKRLKCAFPFAATESDIQGVVARNSGDLPAPIVERMISFKPFKDGDPLLWALNEISNCSKHRITKAILSPVGAITADQISLRGPGAMFGRWDAANSEMMIASYAAGSELSIDGLKFQAYPAFGDIEVVKSEPLLPVFDALAEKVQHILDDVEKLSIGLGFLKSKVGSA